jgi:imidazolonepropionase-like amidohydrolase
MLDDQIVIRAGSLLDVARGELLADQAIVVRDGRVEAVLPAGAPVPDTQATIDLSALTVLPGLIDCHAHLVGDIEGSDVPSIRMSEAQEVLIGVRNAGSTLRAGFTTVRDVGTFRAFLDCALRDAINAGWVDGPRMQCAGAYVTAPEGGGELTGLPAGSQRPANTRVGVVRDETEVRAAVDRILDGGADLIKVIATGAVLTRGTDVDAVEVPEALIRVAVEAAAERGAFVAAHAHGAEGIKQAIRAGVRSVEHGSLLDDEGIELMLRAGTVWVPDIYDGDWIEEQGRREGWPAETMAKNAATTDAQRQAFRRAVEAGVTIAYGTDSGVYPHGWNARQLGYMVRFGMTPLAAIRAATLVAAELMGWTDRVGSLAPGRWADAIVVSGDPLADITVLERPTSVIKGGRLTLVSPDGGRPPAPGR